MNKSRNAAEHRHLPRSSESDHAALFADSLSFSRTTTSRRRHLSLVARTTTSDSSTAPVSYAGLRRGRLNRWKFCRRQVLQPERALARHATPCAERGQMEPRAVTTFQRNSATDPPTPPLSPASSSYSELQFPSLRLRGNIPTHAYNVRTNLYKQLECANRRV